MTKESIRSPAEEGFYQRSAIARSAYRRRLIGLNCCINSFHLLISKNLNGIVITGRINLILDNVDSSNKPIEGIAFNNNVVLESNRTSNLPVLIDGNLTGGYWYPSNTSTYLTLHLPQEELIKGVIINTGTGSYQFASVRVATQRNSGQAIQGVFATKQVGTEHYIKFKTPVSAKAFKFDNFLTLRGGAQPDIMEIRLVK